MDKMDEGEIHNTIRSAEIEHTLKGEYLSTISERVTRYLELNFIKIIPNEHFSSISAECILLYRDGHFFACIALCQAIAEVIVRLMCEKSGFRANKVFEKNIDTLHRRKIKPDCNELLEEIWKGRDDYHHLNPKVPTEREKLQVIAKSKILALHSVESEVFAFEWVSGAIKPKYPKYWTETRDGFLEGFLRFEP